MTVVITVAVAAVALAASARAQDAAAGSLETWQRRERGLGVLVRRYDSLLAAADDEARRRDATLPVDTLTVGRYKAAVRGIPTPQVRQLLRSADSVWSHSWAAQVPVIPGAVLQFQQAGTDAAQREWMEVTIGRQLPRAPWRPQGSARVRLTPRTPREARDHAIAVADLVLEQWRLVRPGARHIPGFHTDTAALARAAFEGLATSPLFVGRTCLSGSLQACELALGLRAPTPPYDDVLDAAGRAAILEAGMSRDWPVSYADRRACEDTRDDELCRRAFAGIALRQLRQVWTAEAVSLLAARVLPVAIGAGRMDTLVASRPDYVSADLKAMAGDSLPHLLAAWRQSVVSHRPKRVLPPAVTAWTALLLAALLTAAGLRTSRWKTL